MTEPLEMMIYIFFLAIAAWILIAFKDENYGPIARVFLFCILAIWGWFCVTC